MKKLTLCTVLMIISLQAKLYAQQEVRNQMMRSKTDQTFNLTDFRVTKRDFVVLKEGKLILDLLQADDYNAFKNSDSILMGFMRDIAFYKDSLTADPTGHVRIDYVLSENYSFKKIRFKRYKSDGDIYMNRDGEIAKLKFDYDTVRIIVQRSTAGLGSKKNRPCSIEYAIQATFLLGNYTDINKIIAGKELDHIIDTLQQATMTKRSKRERYEQLSMVYNPYYNGKARFSRVSWLMNSEYSAAYHKPMFTFNPQFGLALIKNNFAPIADIGFQFNQYWNNNTEQQYFRISASGYYLFDKNAAGDLLVNDQWFVNVSYATVSDRNYSGWFGREGSFGIGYLLSSKGGYFKGSTFRMFTDIMFVRGITIQPEVICTNDFKQIFPGITVKVF